MSDKLDFIFTGQSAKECDDFIQAVRDYARANGKARDNVWIAEEVGDALSGRALRWYWKQTPEAHRDWRLLQKALVERWLDDSDDDDNAHRRPSGENAPPPAQGPIPTPAAAVPNGKSSELSGKTGRLKCRTGLLRTSEMFLSKSTYSTGGETWRLGAFLVTSDPKAAMHVKLTPAGDGLWQLEMVTHPSGRKFVAASFAGANCYGFLVGVDNPFGTCLKDHDSTYGGDRNHQFQTVIWRLEDDRYLSLAWSENASDREKKRVPILWRPDEGLVLDRTHTTDGSDKQVEFEFEVLED